MVSHSVHVAKNPDQWFCHIMDGILEPLLPALTHIGQLNSFFVPMNNSWQISICSLEVNLSLKLQYSTGVYTKNDKKILISSHAFRIHLIWNDFWENFAEISLYFIQQFRKLDVSCFKILMILNWILGVHYVKRTVSIGLFRFVVGSAKENKHRHPYEFYENIYRKMICHLFITPISCIKFLTMQL